MKRGRQNCSKRSSLKWLRINKVNEGLKYQITAQIYESFVCVGGKKPHKNRFFPQTVASVSYQSDF